MLSDTGQPLQLNTAATWQDVINKHDNTLYRNFEITPGEKRKQGGLRTTVLLDRTSAVYSVNGSPHLLLVKEFLSQDQHDELSSTFQSELGHGYFGIHNDYRLQPSRSSQSMAKQKILFELLERLLPDIKAIMDAFCKGDQEMLYSSIKPEYITGVVGTTVELLHIPGTANTQDRAQYYHFDLKNARDTMCAVLCVGAFETCHVEIPDSSVVVETSPRDIYFFLGGDMRHRVGRPLTNKGNGDRYSVVIFTHAAMYQQPRPREGEPPAEWLAGRAAPVATVASLEQRLSRLEQSPVVERKMKKSTQHTRDRRDLRRFADKGVH